MLVTLQAIIVILSLHSVLELGSGISSATGYGYVVVTQLASNGDNRVHWMTLRLVFDWDVPHEMSLQ
jgi:hypothetical protein